MAREDKKIKAFQGSLTSLPSLSWWCMTQWVQGQHESGQGPWTWEQAYLFIFVCSQCSPVPTSLSATSLTLPASSAAGVWRWHFGGVMEPDPWILPVQSSAPQGISTQMGNTILHLSDCDFCFSDLLLFSQQLVFTKANITDFWGVERGLPYPNQRSPVAHPRWGHMFQLHFCGMLRVTSVPLIRCQWSHRQSASWGECLNHISQERKCRLRKEYHVVHAGKVM